jgi:hypothetical protein
MKYSKAWANSKPELTSFNLNSLDPLVLPKSVSNETLANKSVNQTMLDTVKASVDKLFDETFPQKLKKKKKNLKSVKPEETKPPAAFEDRVWISFFAILFVVFFLFFVLFQRLQNLEQSFIAWRSSIPTLK